MQNEIPKMNFPADFISSCRSLLGNEAELFFAALGDDPPVSFRLNPFKADRNPLQPAFPLQRVPWSQWGFYLDKRPSFTFDPLFHAGYYYVQEASSMFVEHVINQLVEEPVMCLDLCAAPGGKSLSLLSALPQGSLLVSNELVRQRANVLSETLTKFGNPYTLVSNNRANDFAGFTQLFDLILVDAPCSGEGMFRKDETAVSEWSAGNVQMCAIRQREILSDIWPALKPGGLLVYSTCTFNTIENEENALWAASELGAEFVSVEIEEGWGISPSLDNRVEGYRFFPHLTQGEGLFVTVLRKAGEEPDAVSGNKSTPGKQGKPGKQYKLDKQGKPGRYGGKNGKRSLSFFNGRSVSANFLHPEEFVFVETGNRVIALPAEYSEMFIDLGGQLKTISMGMEAGIRKGKDFIPSHALAMSKKLHPDAFPCHEVEYGKAIAYLRRESIVLPDAPSGYLLLTYQGEPLGFVKNLGNRANNLYPGEWRIRSTRLPAETVGIFTPK